ncbi:type II toxin-antitoxin system prevent-host-death family antitoxin [Candidatus Chloroploca sp. M-50]|uniref:Type II toxin-antitoxin system prevent-host-death family antitoxin n=1 Tax=Candidatus Chloroploca mongolica TaxID=2528176 RepID=A0ABS4DH67_9CHLR|nr:type II toxin-antitoxin system prevent-host-death family antitoxin [Candidatus Chloroploca mongolica]MBP1468796.1 type II toxin-antitoxin system prevent-host-death family antitoxin [Candidatus Chloroploca mongolica]
MLQRSARGQSPVVITEQGAPTVVVRSVDLFDALRGPERGASLPATAAAEAQDETAVCLIVLLN